MTIRYTTHQVQMGLKQFAKKELSLERLRQLRSGRTESKRRGDGSMYRRRYEPVLEQVRDWNWFEGEVAYTTNGVRLLFQRYDVKLTQEMKDWMRQLPAKRPGPAVTQSRPSVINQQA